MKNTKFALLNKQSKNLTIKSGHWHFPVLLICACATATVAWPSSNRTPPMGWNSWNAYLEGSLPDDWKSERYFKSLADALVSSGLRAAGYKNITLTGMAYRRDSRGGYILDPVGFPSGPRALTKYFRDRSLSINTYTDLGVINCYNYNTDPWFGSYGHYQQDADTFAAWGSDGIKADWCGGEDLGLDPRTQYTQWREAVEKTGRPMIIEVCCWGEGNPWEWGSTAGTYWRVSGDISNDWGSVMGEFDVAVSHASAAGPGKGWNFPDMLEVGLSGGLTIVEERTHFTLWCILASPLIISLDPLTMSDSTKSIILNPEAIAVDQDTAGIQGVEVAPGVWSKPLAAPNSRAVALFNRGSSALTIKAKWNRIGLSAGPATVRDIWQRKDLGVFSDSFSTQVPSHGCAFLKIVSGTTGVGAPAPSRRQIGSSPKAAIVLVAGFASGPESALKGFDVYDVMGKRVWRSDRGSKEKLGTGGMGVYITAMRSERTSRQP